MKKRWVIFMISVLGIPFLYFGVLNFFCKKSPLNPAFNKKENHYFYPISIVQWNDGQCPCLPVQIEGNEVLCLLDLGFSGHFFLFLRNF
jgi:hypothetical protein